MTRKGALGAIALAILIGAGIAAFAYFRSAGAPPEFQGWVEADIVFVSPDEIGRVATLSVREGSAVEVGSPLFTLDNDLQQAAAAENEAAVINAKQSYDRAKALLKSAAGSQKALDDAEAALRSAEARLNSTRTRLDRRRMLSPVAGTIHEVYFRVGEMVEPGRPIVSIVPPGNIKVRFFVPQPELSRVPIGQHVTIRCDGCATTVSATVSYVSTEPEFTPPIIYSNENRAKLVFMVEARPAPEAGPAMHPGQPVEVVIE